MVFILNAPRFLRLPRRDAVKKRPAPEKHLHIDAYSWRHVNLLLPRIWISGIIFQLGYAMMLKCGSSVMDDGISGNKELSDTNKRQYLAHSMFPSAVLIDSRASELYWLASRTGSNARRRVFHT